ncbi:MAG: hypothetical protein KKF68_02615 [Nanoarchaeota archaeon]|nr:hypothetical protein [Nanoarchaeota archaeon]
MKFSINVYLLFLGVFLFVTLISALNTNSSNYTTDIILSRGGTNTSSDNYITSAIIGTITGEISSSLYQQYIGFFFGELAVSAGNTAPDTPPPSINSTAGNNYANQNLNCFATITDSNSDLLNVTVEWYKNSVVILAIDYNNSYSSGTSFNSVLYSGNTSVEDVWKCGVRLYDGQDYSEWGNSSTLTIVAETAEEEPPVTGGSTGGGGGGVVVSKLLRLKVIPESINIPGAVGINRSEKISLENIGDSVLNVEINLVNLQGIVSFRETNLSLKIGETKVLEYRVTPPNEPGIYAGKIVFSTGNEKLEVPFALNVRSKTSLFDISIDIPDEYKSIRIGEKVKGQITLIQAGLKEEVDVSVVYVIKDFEGEVYFDKTETIMVFDQKIYEYFFPTQDLLPGDYLIGVEVIYAGGVATASHQFKVEDVGEKRSYFILIVELFLVICIFITLIFLVKKYKKKKKPL